MRDCIEVARANGLNINKAKLCGGGARSALWRQIIANVCNVEVEIPLVEEGPAYGGAMLAMVACGAYKTVEEAASALISIKSAIKPDAQIAEMYQERYNTFTALYAALKDSFKRW